jgi:hypothetical protein
MAKSYWGEYNWLEICELYTSATNHLFLIFSGIPFEQQKNVILAGLFYRNIISAFMIKIDTMIVGEMKYLKFHMEAHVNQQFLEF